MRPSIHIRLPAILHERLVALAVEQGVSLNLLVATLLAAAVPFDFRPDDEQPAEPDEEHAGIAVPELDNLARTTNVGLGNVEEPER